MGHPLGRIVHGDGQVVTRRRIGAPEHDIPPGGWLGFDLPLRSVAGFLPGEPLADEGTCLVDVEPPGMALCGRQPFSPFGLGEAALLRRIEGCTVRIARPDGALALMGRDTGLHLAAREEGGIDEAHGLQSIECFPVKRKMLRLAAGRGFEGDPEPGKIVENRLFEFPAAAGKVDILDAQQEAAAHSFGHVGVQKSRERVAEMQTPIGARREAKDGGIVAHGLTRRFGHAFPSHESGMRKRGRI